MKLMKLTMTSLILGGMAMAQGPMTDGAFYKLDFVVKEVEGGKVLSSRSYSMTAGLGGGSQSIRAGSKVPYSTNGGTQFNFADIGVNLDCRLRKEDSNRLSMDLMAEVSSIVLPTDGAGGQNPIIRQNRWNSQVNVPLSRPTIVFSSDDLSLKRQMQLEVTATPFK